MSANQKMSVEQQLLKSKTHANAGTEAGVRGRELSVAHIQVHGEGDAKYGTRENPKSKTHVNAGIKAGVRGREPSMISFGDGKYGTPEKIKSKKHHMNTGHAGAM